MVDSPWTIAKISWLAQTAMDYRLWTMDNKLNLSAITSLIFRYESFDEIVDLAYQATRQVMDELARQPA